MIKKILAMALALCMVASMVACSSSSTTTETAAETTTTTTTTEAAPEAEAATEEAAPAAEEASSDAYVIGFAPATLNNAFWLAVEDGVKIAIAELGIDVELIEVDANGDQSIMNDRISELVSAGVDAVLIAPADSTASKEALLAMDAAGIPAINFDTPVPETELVETIIASDNYYAGYVVGLDAAAKMPDGAKVLVLHSPRASACVERFDGFIQALDESGKSYTIVNNLDGEGDQETSLLLATDALIADPDMNVIFAVNDPSAMGAANAIAQSSNPDAEILVYGVDGNPDAKVMIKNGDMTGTGAQSPESLGYLSMMAAYEVLTGGSVEAEVVVPTFLIDATNVDEYGTDGWQ